MDAYDAGGSLPANSDTARNDSGEPELVITGSGGLILPPLGHGAPDRSDDDDE